MVMNTRYLAIKKKVSGLIVKHAFHGDHETKTHNLYVTKAPRTNE